MYYKIKASIENNGKSKIETWLTTGTNFAEAAQKVIQEIGTNPEIEDICLMKQFKPAINEWFEGSKVYVVKISEDMTIDDKIKTIKYPMPVFARDNDELQKLVKDYISQGLDDMRLTTISETKWNYIE